MLKKDQASALLLLQALASAETSPDYVRISKKYPKQDGNIFKKTEILEFYNQSQGILNLPLNSNTLLKLLRVKPVRTLSGVTPITVLTKPFPCPGECIFCPSDVRMPKSYLSKEPGAQRAATAAFDPYLQVYSRLEAYAAMGHPYQKVELIVLGGTWSVYPEPYRIWFVKRLFDALNDFSLDRDDRNNIKLPLKKKIPDLSLTKDSPQFVIPSLGKTYNQDIKSIYGSFIDINETCSWSELASAHLQNETAQVRCIGLVLETRPDYINFNEIRSLRRLGATKIQLGIQSLNDRVLTLNRRGHTVAQSCEAVGLLRRAGFKLHLHWMPNLYGSSVKQDKQDFNKLFSNPAIRPDELKIYPCSVISGTELMTRFETGDFTPYTHAELSEILSYCLIKTPRYCRITRMVRDIPGHDIAVGNKLTNFRQIAETKVKVAEGIMNDIRAREIKEQAFILQDLKLKTTRYLTSVTTEYFLEYVTPNDQITAFIRLSLPLPTNSNTHFFPELESSALIREVHVYGQALDINTQKTGMAQHIGLGKKLIAKAITLSKSIGFKKLSVISAVGTREYYRKLGFKDGKLYQHYEL